MPTTHTLKIAGETYTGVDTLQMKGANSEEGKIIEYVAAEWETLSFDDDTPILGTHKPSAGKDGFSQVTIASNNLISKNIRKGVTIFGVEGIYAPSYYLQGTWDFPANDTTMYDALRKITSTINEAINFKVRVYYQSEGEYYYSDETINCTGIQIATNGNLYYKKASGTLTQAFSMADYSWISLSTDGGFEAGKPLRLEFGDTPQTVSEQFYAWFVATATKVSGGGFENVSIATGTLTVSAANGGTLSAPVVSDSGISTINYQLSAGVTKIIENIALNAPFVIKLPALSSYYYYYSETNVTELAWVYRYDAAFTGVLTATTGSISFTVDCCFDGTSKVLLPNGATKALVDINIGDTVMSYNETTGVIEENKVIAFGTVTLRSATEITLTDDTVIRMNIYHPLYTQDGWKSITRHNGLPELTIEDKLLNSEGKYIGIKSIETVAIEEETYYTLKVENNNNFYVNGILAQGKDKD